MFSIHHYTHEPQSPNPHGEACSKAARNTSNVSERDSISLLLKLFNFISGIGALAARLFWEQDQACSIHASRTILCRGRMAMQLTVNQPHGGSIPPDTATWVASITAMCLPFKQYYLSSILRRPTISPYSLTDKALLS